MFPIWETTQKYESLAWEIVIEPTPNDIITHTLPISESNPIVGNKGKTIDDVVIIEIVDDPWAVLRKAAIKKGNIINWISNGKTF